MVVLECDFCGAPIVYACKNGKQIKCEAIIIGDEEGEVRKHTCRMENVAKHVKQDRIDKILDKNF